MLRRLSWILLVFTVAGLVSVAPTRANADSGWSRYKPGSGTYVWWHMRYSLPPDPTEAEIRKYGEWRAAAIWRARRAHTRWINRHWRHAYGSVDWDRIASCESGGRWHYNGPSGYDGGLQFLPSTWSAVMRSLRARGIRWARRTAYAWQATRLQQIRAASHLIGPMHANPWRQWPHCWRYA